MCRLATTSARNSLGVVFGVWVTGVPTQVTAIPMRRHPPALTRCCFRLWVTGVPLEDASGQDTTEEGRNLVLGG